MDLSYYLMLLSSGTVQYNQEYNAPPMEPPESPKFNVALWQPWLSSEDPEKCSESSSPGSAPNTRSAAAKQLPTTKWKRDRRSSTRLPDYKPRDGISNGSSKAASRSNSFKEQPAALHDDVTDGPVRTSVNLARTESAGKGDLTAFGIRCDAEIPIDMSLSGKPRGSPPPYNQAISNQRPGRSPPARPSVIARAAPIPIGTQLPAVTPASLSMCDPVIDEHFRRSLGADYMALFANKNNNNYPQSAEQPASVDRGSSPILFASDPSIKFLTQNKESIPEKPRPISPPQAADKKVIAVQMEVDDGAGLSVDDHFAKALGDTWKKLQENQHKPEVVKPRPAGETSNDKNDSSASKILSRRGVVI